METKFNFNSQVCTDKNQSERLLALGLKKETADCYYWQETEPMYGEAAGIWHLENLDSKDNQEHFEYLDKYFGVCLADDEEHYFIPAWSLHRLWCLLPHSITIVTHFEYGRQYRAGLDLTMDSYQNVCYLEGVDEPCYDMSFFANDAYESICKAIEWLIKEGYFPKEYLV